MLANREKAIETKLQLLERRLVLVEQFIEIRFQESLQTFSVRNKGVGATIKRVGKKKNDRLIELESPGLQKPVEDSNEQNYIATQTRSGRSSRRPSRLSHVKVDIKRKAARVDSSDKELGTKGSITSSQLEPTTMTDEDGEYFIFPTDEDDADKSVGLHGHEEDVDTEIKSRRKTKKTHKSATRRAPYSTRKKAGSVNLAPDPKLAIQNLIREQCPICHKYFRKELINTHKEFHAKERHLKCSYCDKTFFNRTMVLKHEKLHQPEKYAKKCRLCDKTTIESGKMLVHERSCIRRALEQNKFVEQSLLDDIRKRSPGMDLKWPDPSLTASSGNDTKKCAYCSEYFNYQEYSKHVKMHATWVCALCENSYVNKDGLMKHVKNVHGVKSMNAATIESCQKQENCESNPSDIKKPTEDGGTT